MATMTSTQPLDTILIPEQQSVRTIDRDDYADLFASLFERSGVCLVIVDRKLRLLDANQPFVRQFGRGAGEATGLPFCDLLHPGVRQRVAQQFSMLVDGHRVRVHERVVCLSIRPTTFAAELTGIAVCNETNRTQAILALFEPETQAYENKPRVHSGKMLTALEARILEGAAAGLSTVQLAGKLYLSRQGVEYHVSAMLRRFRVPNRAALISKAYSIGIFGVDSWPPKALPDFVR